MAKKSGVTRLIPLNQSKKPVEAPVVKDEGPDLARSFMQKHPQGSLPADPPDDTPGSLSAPVLETAAPPVEEVPAVEAPETDSQGEPVAPQSPEEVKPAAKVEAARAEAVEPKPTDKPAEPKVEAKVEPVKPTYAPEEVLHLAEGADWTREQVVYALKERAELQPKAAEADKFGQLLGFKDYTTAEAQWKPVLDSLRSDPQKPPLVQAILDADADKLEYLAQSAAFYDTQVASGAVERPATKVPAQPAPDSIEARERAELRSFMDEQRKNAAITRANTERTDALTRYPFLQTDGAAWDALLKTAVTLYNFDLKSGKPEWECRGLADAIAMNKPLLDGRNIVAAQERISPPPMAAPLSPNTEPQALLGSPGPTPSGVRQTQPKAYTGDPDQAVSAFLEQYPGS